MILHAAEQEPRAPRDRFSDVRVRDSDLVEEEIQDWVEIGVGVAVEELGEHVEDSAHGGTVDSHGGEALFDGSEGGERGGSEVRVYSESLLGVHVEFLEVEDFFPENEAAV